MKLNIVFDGNHLMHLTKSVVMNYDRSINLTDCLDTEEKRGVFLRKCITNFCAAVNLFANECESLSFTFDEGTPWRKQIYPEYKGNRVKDEQDQLGYTYFYQVMDLLKEILVSKGIPVYSKKSIEADDLLCYISRNNTRLGKKTLIMTGDKDMHQLLVEDYVFIYNYNSTVKTLYHAGNLPRELYCSAYSNKKINVEEFIFKKILLGDNGDNVKNVCRGFGEKAVDKAWDIAMNTGYSIVDYDEQYYEGIYIICQSIKKGIDEQSFIENYKRNLKLMYLDESTYSPQQISEMEELYKNNQHRKYEVVNELKLNNFVNKKVDAERE